ncbi:LEAF RUST 10 DISEASE-RESISTANCE LOCUS RECEPTOR-LIKE PROTEIN KINASE-like 1.1 [Abrus precatorius]|uniref:LEAF RUST 10 DISEASE-RESISTANCE LOCUS RECEPTOR-LIKE PROTEIN KINASE-like 1.1 n=1 Tax=Abrus precatorius TaxID=3816 RepID=A0A8B8MAF3_ABRPR|nr:LEAF RUST 10 DISEASE-RESISTANCE LOCUS RECEPTOR-LIKE PROTEIN KINASE-like 1.1 [Abrus precatorius]
MHRTRLIEKTCEIIFLVNWRINWFQIFLYAVKKWELQLAKKIMGGFDDVRVRGLRVSEVYVLFCGLTVLRLPATGSHEACPHLFDCGNLGTIGFPFTTIERKECGALAIYGCDDSNQTAEKHVRLNNGGKRFQVTKVEQRWRWWYSISIIDHDFREVLQNASCNCKAFSYNITLPPHSSFGSFYIEKNITAFQCNKSKTLKMIPSNFFKNKTCSEFDIYFGPSNSDDASLHSLVSTCSTHYFPVGEGFVLSGNPWPYFTPKFTIQFSPSDYCNRCHHSAGHCQLDNKSKVYCATRRRSGTWKLGLGLGDVQTHFTGLGIGASMVFGLILLWRCKRKHGRGRAQGQLHSTNAYADPHSETERIFFGVPVFSYKDLQEATNNFDLTRKLGDGGFGTVYYGKLGDGREVAIKHLFEHNYRRVEQFMNEIEILTRLRHKNLVSLYGCTSRHSHELLLVYEYIPNGTVASHLHGNLSRVGVLTWPIRMQIAIDTATALAYLHASNIIHRDVKTNNILLDINFSVKVADFGLSRLLPNDATHVSTAPQGSPGYLDPEYFQCYQLTDKSDVYSFGVVLIELISSMPAVDAARERDEVKLANLASKKIQKGKLCELVDPSLGFELDHQVTRMLTSVAELAIQCVQGDRELRPSMDEVVEALQKFGSGKYEREDLVLRDESAGISSGEEVHLPSSASQDSGQVGYFMNQKLPASPKSLTEKWECESTTPSSRG